MLRVALSLALTLVASAATPELGVSNFYDTIVAEPAQALVLFFSPECGHCAAMMPSWRELEGILAASKESAGNGHHHVRLATVDATTEKLLSERIGVHGYPTLLLFHVGGLVTEYDGDRSAASMLEFARGGTSGRRRGFLGADGTVRPGAFDALLRAPLEAYDILNIAVETSLPGSLIVGAGLMLIGVLVTLATSPADAPQFIVVTCPPDVRPGHAFNVEIIQSRGRLSFLRLWQPRTRSMQVVAPAGIGPGQTFFVPLVPPPPLVSNQQKPGAAAQPPTLSAATKKGN
jgi:thiol-disulfide isomerase/thioredoxin